MIVRTPTIERSTFEAETGWTFKPEGACKGEVCIPLPDSPGEEIDVRAMAGIMGLPLAEDSDHGLLAVGPESIGSKALTTAIAPDVRLPDLQGNQVALADFRGQKILVYAWAPY